MMKFFIRVPSLVLGLSLLVFTGVGCGSGVRFGVNETSQTFSQNANTVNNKIDILWVVDNSSSMESLQDNLTSNFGTFVTSLEANHYDFRMAVTTTDAYESEVNFLNNPNLAQFSDGVTATPSGVFVILPTTPNLDSVFVTNASQGVNGSGDERAFSSMRDALSSPLNSGFHRSDAFLAVIILSDEDDFSGAGRPEFSWLTTGGIPDHSYTASTLDTVDSYVSYLDNLTQSTGTSRKYNISSVAVLDNACYMSHVPSSVSTIIGQRYIQISNETQGVTGSICDLSYGPTLIAISNQITALSTQFFLNETPNASTIQVFVNGAVVPENDVNGWSYSSVANSILFHGTSTPAQGSTINVVFLPLAVSHS